MFPWLSFSKLESLYETQGDSRTPEHHTALQGAVLSAFTTAPPCDRKGNHPPGAAAQAEAARLAGDAAGGGDVTVDLAVYAKIVGGVS